MILSMLSEQALNPWLLAFVMTLSAFISREWQHRKELLRYLEDGQKANEQWKKAFEDQRASFDEQLKILQEAKNVVWVKMRSDGEADKPDKSKTH